jgi:hypothetical protein
MQNFGYEPLSKGKIAMSENDFNRALQAAAMGELALTPNLDQMVRQIIRRDQRRTQILAFCSVIFWLGFVAGMLAFVFGLNRFVLSFRLNQHTENIFAMRATTQSALDRSEELMLWGTSFIHHSMPYLAASVIAFLLGVLCNLMLIFSSRQGVLNRINFSLARMSEQLKQLRPHSTKADGG